MTKSEHRVRLYGLAVFLSFVFIGLGGRLVYLQVFQHEKYRKLAGLNIQTFQLREPRRGDILDANGNPLATSYLVKKVFANPSHLGHRYADAARVLAPLLS